MSEFYTNLSSTAESLFGRFGQAVTLVRPTSGAATYDPATGAATMSAGASYAGVGVRMDYTGFELANTSVRDGDFKVYATFDSAAVRPRAGDRLTLGSTTYAVVQVTTLAPGEQSVMHTLHVRGATP